jgi:hypothetical protein
MCVTCRGSFTLLCLRVTWSNWRHNVLISTKSPTPMLCLQDASNRAATGPSLRAKTSLDERSLRLSAWCLVEFDAS